MFCIRACDSFPQECVRVACTDVDNASELHSVSTPHFNPKGFLNSNTRGRHVDDNYPASLTNQDLVLTAWILADKYAWNV